MKKNLILLMALCVVIMLTACGQDSKPAADARHVRLGCVESLLDMANFAVPYIKAHGYEPEVVLIEGNVNMIRAVNDGGLDAALGVHVPFMEKFNKDNKGDLVMVKPYAHYAGMGLFSDKYKTVAELPQGAKIAIMNDAMNMDRGLKILRDTGLIQLDEIKKDSFTTLDVTKNPKKIELIDMDQAQTVRSLQDLDGAIVFFTHIRNAGRDCRSYMVKDTHAAEYPSGVVVKQANEGAPWAKVLGEALRTDEMRQFVAEKYAGVYEYYP